MQYVLTVANIPPIPGQGRKRPPVGVILALFLGTYLALFLILTAGGAVYSALQNGLASGVTVLLMGMLLFFQFPSGLAGFWPSLAAPWPQVIGYGLYLVLLICALIFRKSWQTRLLWLLLVVLMLINFVAWKIALGHMTGHAGS